MPRQTKNEELKVWLNVMKPFIFRTVFDKYNFLTLVQAEDIDAATEMVNKKNKNLTGHITTCEGQVTQFEI